MKLKKCYGRTPGDIKAVRPMKDGVIADFTATQLMLKNIMQKIVQRHNLGKPRVVVGVPSGITEVEERAVEESVLQAGAKEVYLIEEPMAAAIGANLDVAEPCGTRKICICVLTYIVVIAYSYIVRNYSNILLSSLVPVIGFTLSTLSLKYIRKMWEKNVKNDQ